MRSTFPGYYPPTDDELSEMWTRGRIVFDTNVLLNLFRYSEATRKEFIDILESLKERLWIPHHVGLEFQNRRHDVIHDQAVAFDEVTRAITSGLNGIEKALNNYNHHPTMTASQLKDLARSKLGELTTEVERARLTHKTEVERSGVNDQVLAQITELFTAVGDPYDAGRLSDVQKEAEERYAKKIPPGYKDADKSNGNQYGDYIIWCQILDFVRQEPTPVIFVTDDQKEDWWQIVHGQTKGPRPELVQDFEAVCGKRLHLYTSTNFIREGGARTHQEVQEDAIREVEEVAASHLEEALKRNLDAAQLRRWDEPHLTRRQLARLLEGAPTYSDKLMKSLAATDDSIKSVRQRITDIKSILEFYDSEQESNEYYSPDHYDNLRIELELLHQRLEQLLVERDLERTSMPSWMRRRVVIRDHDAEEEDR